MEYHNDDDDEDNCHDDIDDHDDDADDNDGADELYQDNQDDNGSLVSSRGVAQGLDMGYVWGIREGHTRVIPG